MTRLNCVYMAVVSIGLLSFKKTAAFWNHMAGKVGLDFGVVGIAHMFGLNTEEIIYEPRSFSANTSVNTRIYYRFIMTIHIGK